ncbi:MAG TPA: Ku protein [Noviherbaspirillum sp.]|uniref:Ku protein n=1 Tax=Oxalobacteraceae TaxID=75682 RepID=UPI001455E262|nr:Ku protein [Herbaspirillum sp. ST 5-3]HJV51061.1 Ku protein [Noviherbaspirillum sp.]
MQRASSFEERFVVILPDQEVRATHAKSTHAVDILAFVDVQEIPSLYFETPYYLTPAPGGEKLYALLRELLRTTGKIGIACVVIQSRQHLAAVVPRGQSLVLQTLRWASESLHPRLNVALSDPATGETSESELALPPSFISRAQEGWTITGDEDDAESLRDDLCTDDASPFGDRMLTIGQGTEIEVEELDDWLEENDADDGDSLLFLIPSNPHAGAPRPASRQRHPARMARARTRRTLH